MKITESQVDRFIELYKNEYGTVLERIQAVKQIQALLFFVCGISPNIADVDIGEKSEYNIHTTNKVRRGRFNNEEHKEG